MTNPSPSTLKTLATKLVDWYQAHRRDLPWRVSRDPYRIWVSEVMLQQTTVTAVIPYYEKFMARFPSVSHLAQAPLAEVLEAWTGLGYYSRARNLHRSAQALAKQGFPRTHQELLELPGFGPYTARAVASLAFSEPVGVLDGNVIRVLSRVFAEPFEHWKTKDRAILQDLADQIASQGPSEIINQGLMELGATICTPKSTQCFLCPWLGTCRAQKLGRVEELPLAKPRKEMETWIWKPWVLQQGERIALTENNYAPFLKKQWLFPGEVQLQTRRPKKFDLRHGITHHDIYVRLASATSSEAKRLLKGQNVKWVAKNKLTEWNPSILLRKVLDFHEK